MTTKRALRALSIFVLGFLLLSYVNTTRAEHGGHRAKHIILLIGDGMNIEHEIATSRYLYSKDFDLSFHKLPYQANVATWDVGVTCPRTSSGVL